MQCYNLVDVNKLKYKIFKKQEKKSVEKGKIPTTVKEINIHYITESANQATCHRKCYKNILQKYYNEFLELNLCKF